MNDKKFTAEYKKLVDSVNLPCDYKDKILSNLRAKESSDFLVSDPEKSKAKKHFKLAASLVAAVLVIAVGLSVILSIGPKLPKTRVIRLNIASATNLSNISGARIVFKNSRGEFLKDDEGETLTAITDENGVATATIPTTEEFRAQITMDGYIPIEETAESGNYYISPVMSENTYRAVLTWNKECDLDAHLSVTTEKGIEKLHYFNSDIDDKNGTVIAALDVDNEKGDGPETITFNAYDDMLFRFSVASYSALKSSNADKLSDAGAQVTLYRGNICIGTYAADTNSEGNVWCVFEIDDSELNVCNYTYSVSAITEIK